MSPVASIARRRLWHRLLAVAAASTIALNAAPTSAAASAIVIEVASQQPGGLMVLMVSSSDGWGDLASGLADGFAERGAPVIGIDLSRFRAADDANAIAPLAALVGDTIAAKLGPWRTRKLALLGCGTGARLLPHLVAALAPEWRGMILQASFVEPSPPSDPEADRSFASAMAQIGIAALQCFETERQVGPPCGAEAFEGMEVTAIDSRATTTDRIATITRRVLSGAKRRAARPPMSSSRDTRRARPRDPATSPP